MKFEFKSHSPKGCYEGIDLSEWTNWQWQLRHAIKSIDGFSKVYKLSADEIQGFQKSSELFQIRTTPYYATLASFENSLDPLRLIQTPHLDETRVRFQEMLDPLGEDQNSVNHRLIHRYSDRVLFLVTDFCSVYCRFCTRKRFTGKSQSLLSKDEYENSLSYIRSHPEIREVILSGGDPLTLSDEQIERILFDIRKIDHVEIIRIGSRMTVVNPFRITREFAHMLQKFKPVYFMNHFNHPRELTAEAATALELLVDHGVPMFNQMVLLNGVNNHHIIVQALSRRLLYLRVKPYYMFQCDPSLGTDHLRTSIADSKNIQRELWGHMSGLAMPTYSIDIPHGGGKTTMTPQYLSDLASQDPADGIWKFRGFDGVESEYVDPAPEFIRKPIDVDIYEQEWMKK